MWNYMGHPGVAFIAGRTFQTEYGTHEAGSLVKEATKFPNLDVLVSAGFLHPFSPDNGYEYLPAHLFTGTNLKSELDALMKGDTTPSAVEQFPDGPKPEAVAQAEKEAELNEQAHEALLRVPQQRVVEDTRTQRPPVAENKPQAQPAAKTAASKPAAKKAAAATKKEEK